MSSGSFLNTIINGSLITRFIIQKQQSNPIFLPSSIDPIPSKFPVLMASSNSSVVVTSLVLGGFQPVPDVNDEHVQELGMFAVAEHNKAQEEEAALVFVEVVEAQSQVVAGANYSLLIKALDSGLNVRFYKALVYEKPWADVKTLTSFVSVLP